MQIHELTRLDEAGVMDYIKAAVSQDPHLKGYSLTQKAKAMENNKVIKQLGQVLAQQWLAKAAIISKQASAQPGHFAPQAQNQAAASSVKEAVTPANIDPNVYKKYLEDFVNKTAFRNQMKYLDPASKSQVDADIEQIVANRADPKKMIELFQKLAQTAAVTLMSQPGTYKTAPVSAASGTAPTSAGNTPAGSQVAPSTSAITPASLKNTLNSMGVYINPSAAALRQTFEKLSGDIRVESTGNEYADNLLTIFGFDVQ